MKANFILFITLTVVILATFDGIDGANPCVDGTTWKQDCHTCSCTKGNPVCTRELCESEQPYKVVVPEDAEQTTKDPSHIDFTKTCKPGDTWREGCNTCQCALDGTPACTRKLCPPLDSLTVQERKTIYGY